MIESPPPFFDQDAAEHYAGYWETLQKNQQDFFNWYQSFLPIMQAQTLPNKDSHKDHSKDKRFQSPLWQDQGFYQQQASTYLDLCGYVKKYIASIQAPLPEQESQYIGLLTQQWLDAISPSNFLLTNPDAMQAFINTQGQSIWQGLQNYLQDIEKGKITQTDENAFAIGQNIAITPGDVIMCEPLYELIRYHTHVAQATPILLVPPCINKYYILDLQKHNSMVNYLCEQGFAVYLISWKNPNPHKPEDTLWTWDDYLAAIQQTIGVVYQEQQQAMHTMGFCIGGTMLSTALACYPHTKAQVQSLSLLTTLLNFEHSGALGAMVNQSYYDYQNNSIGQAGVLLGKDLAMLFNSLRPQDLIWKYVTENYLLGKPPASFDILYWNSDSSHLPGPMYCWYLKHTYLENRLVKGDAMLMDGQASLNFKQLELPIFALGCEEDHIVPWQGAYQSLDALGGADKTFVLGASGHIAGVIHPASSQKRHFSVLPTHLLNTGVPHKQSGSWWNFWRDWLQAHGKQHSGATAVDGVKKTALYPAPGHYVLEK